jgi:hypothetical protein
MIFVNVTSLTQASADFANQGAYELARTHDPQGLRTVGATPLCFALIELRVTFIHVVVF